MMVIGVLGMFYDWGGFLWSSCGQCSGGVPNFRLALEGMNHHSQKEMGRCFYGKLICRGTRAGSSYTGTAPGVQ